MTEYYLVPKAEHAAEIIVTKSKFIGTLRRIQSLEEMRAFCNELREKHPKANHNCWATIAGSPGDAKGYGFSDDGEPGGTAGKPMFKVLQYSGVGQIGVVVTRYFGGVKLGTGGLVRAYTEAIQAVMESAEMVPFSPSVSLSCVFPYEHESSFRYVVEKHSVQKAEFEYTDCVRVKLTLDEAELQGLEEGLNQKIGHHLQIFREESEGG